MDWFQHFDGNSSDSGGDSKGSFRHLHPQNEETKSFTSLRINYQNNPVRRKMYFLFKWKYLEAENIYEYCCRWQSS